MKLVLSFLLLLGAIVSPVMGFAAAEDSKNVWNGATPVDLQRMQAEHEITRLRGELSNAEQTDTLSNRIYMMGALLAFAFIGTVLLVHRSLNRQIEDESTEIKARYDRHIDPNNEANRLAAMANTENTRLLGYRDTFQTRELGTAPVGQPNTGQFAVPPGFRLVSE